MKIMIKKITNKKNSIRYDDYGIISNQGVSEKVKINDIFSILINFCSMVIYSKFDIKKKRNVEKMLEVCI